MEIRIQPLDADFRPDQKKHYGRIHFHESGFVIEVTQAQDEGRDIYGARLVENRSYILSGGALEEALVTLANPESDLPFHPEILLAPFSETTRLEKAVEIANGRIGHLPAATPIKLS